MVYKEAPSNQAILSNGAWRDWKRTLLSRTVTNLPQPQCHVWNWSQILLCAKYSSYHRNHQFREVTIRGKSLLRWSHMGIRYPNERERVGRVSSIVHS